MTRPLLATIDRAALRHNFGIARGCAGRARLWAVVKANAYGHGLQRTVDTLAELADGFALIELERAVALREAGPDLPILLLEGFYTAVELPLLIRHRLIPVVHRPDQVRMLQEARWPADLPVYLKLNTGMNRLGFDTTDFSAAHAALRGRMPLVLMTHFADADGPRGVDWQLARFAAMTAGLDGPCSLANSAALLRHAQAIGDWVRPGIMLYGGSPFADRSAAELGLQPVMTLRSEIIAVQNLAAGDSVGYGCSFTADKPMCVGVVACGYADGYPRHAPTGTPVLVDGQRTRTLGRVSMDKLCVDLTDLKLGAPQGLPSVAGVTALSRHAANMVTAPAASRVTLWGEGLPADAVAAAAGTISYELFCALAQRVSVLEQG
jgi:alanine racemase